MSQKSDKTPEKPPVTNAKPDKAAGERAKDLPVRQEKADKVKGGAIRYR